ncbi:MAG: hypothetical protein R6X20_19385 [Phycisphaerae bacterium]
MMRRATVTMFAAAAVALASGAAGADYTPEQARGLAVRMAQVDAVNRLTERVLGVELASGETVREALGPGSRNEIALRVFLRSARRVGPARVYSDGVAEVDVQVPVDPVAAKVADLTGRAPPEVPIASLAVSPIEENLTASGRGTAPPGLSDEAVRRIASAPPDRLPDMYPAGWRRVTAAGRVLAARAARVAAYEALSDRLEGILLGRTETVAGLLAGSPSAKTAFESYARPPAATGRTTRTRS